MLELAWKNVGYFRALCAIFKLTNERVQVWSMGFKMQEFDLKG